MNAQRLDFDLKKITDLATMDIFNFDTSRIDGNHLARLIPTTIKITGHNEKHVVTPLQSRKSLIVIRRCI